MKVVVVGLGLIGGSFAKAAIRAGHTVFGVDPHPPADAGFSVQTAADDVLFAPDGSGAPLFLLAVPPAAVVPWVQAHAEDFARGTVVVDAAGVKGTICAALRPFAFRDDWTFIGGHPMAGRETSGFASSDVDLFRGASMILTPYPTCGRGPLDRLEAFFAELGFGRTVITTPERHDEMIALTSQLAHVVSSAYARDPLAPAHAGFSAGSFQDMTRVACLNPDIWTDLFLSNAEALLARIDGLQARIGEIREAIATDDADCLRALLAAGRAARLSYAL